MRKLLDAEGQGPQVAERERELNALAYELHGLSDEEIGVEDYVMKCIICHSTDISMRRVNEQLSHGEDMILIPVEVLVCNNCGERYYDRRTLQRLEEIENEN